MPVNFAAHPPENANTTEPRVLRASNGPDRRNRISTEQLGGSARLSRAFASLAAAQTWLQSRRSGHQGRIFIATFYPNILIAAKWAQLCGKASYPGDGLAVVPEVAFLHDKPVGPETEQRRPGPILAAVGVIPWVSWPG